MVSMENRQMMQAGAPRPAAPSTLVVSDVHGYPELLENALRASGFREGTDRLVFAGDFLDRGSHARECLERLDQLGAETLIGNHDQAIALGYWIGEQQEASKVFREPLLECLRTRRLNLVTSVDGVLISHAGLTSAFAADFDALGRDPARLAARLNDEYLVATLRQLEQGLGAREPRTLDAWSPLWLRVDDADVGPGRLLDGVEQIAGHTTPTVFRRWTEADFRAAGLHAIDPGTYGLGPGDHPLHYRYAVIEDGVVRVESGSVEANGEEAGGAGTETAPAVGVDRLAGRLSPTPRTGRRRRGGGPPSAGDAAAPGRRPPKEPSGRGRGRPRP